MSNHEWKIIWAAICRVNREAGRPPRRCVYPDTLVLAMYIWSVHHDRPRVWAAQRSNYYGPFRPRRLPSRSQFMRRLNTLRCQKMLAALYKLTAPAGPISETAMVDGHPLPLPRHSTDRDARMGRGVGGLANGYKLHAYVTQSGCFRCFVVTPLNVCERNMVHQLLLDVKPSGLVLGDGEFDDAKLFEAACASGGRFIAPPRRHAGRGHVRQAPARLQAIAQWPQDVRIHRRRREIERYFGQLTCYGGGLAPLPAWVRTWPRVQGWVTAKIILYHVRQQSKKEAA